jgi:hypothetical protein
MKTPHHLGNLKKGEVGKSLCRGIEDLQNPVAEMNQIIQV